MRWPENIKSVHKEVVHERGLNFPDPGKGQVEGSGEQNNKI